MAETLILNTGCWEWWFGISKAIYTEVEKQLFGKQMFAAPPPTSRFKCGGVDDIKPKKKRGNRNFIQVSINQNIQTSAGVWEDGCP